MPRLPILFLLITVMLDAMGIGLIMPVIPDLIRDVRGGSLAQAALWGGVLSTVFAVMQFLFSPGLGSLSDHFGRRPVLLVSLAVMALDYLAMALAGSIWILFAGRIVGGITSATQAVASACMADLSAPKDKAANFGLIGAAFGVGFVLGPLIGGTLGALGPRAPFHAAALLATANLIFGLLVMRETVEDKNRRPFVWARANPLRAFRAISDLPGLRPLLWVFFLFSVALYVYPAIWSYFTQERFGWSTQVIGLSLALFGITMALVQGGLIRVALYRLGDRGTVVCGLILNLFSFGLIAMVTEGRLALILTPVAALGTVVVPALQGIMSQRVSDDAQGALQGVLTSVNALATILSPLMMTSAFAAFTGAAAPLYLPGAPFLLAMGLLGAALALFLGLRPSATAVR
ncbi:TCR/Tet family MFS transporter [Antarcticimicrobium luteum]|uniref:MFS transporter n=1 Tax=Antarcticimicrobium luteum TaxID=2547397 RepID=A0A4R5V9Y5_9RHOB|nr:TCR/Tet family MFS transporter [Antarcticimicrobium luteum]TDK48988.1 MFS transporter [Antarcticimicrobium luteum]